MSNTFDASSARHKLLASDSPLGRVFESAKDGIVLLDVANGMITAANPFIAELFGCSREQLLGKQLWEVGLFKDAETNQSVLHELDQGGYVRYDDLPLHTKRGERRVEFTGVIYSEGYHPVIQCNVRDITERKEADEQLRTTLSKLSFHVGNTPLGVIEWDSEFRVSRWSASAEAIFGWKAHEVIGKRIGDWKFVFADDLNTVERLTERQQRGVELQGVSRNRNYAKDGSILYCEWYNSVLIDRERKLESVLSLVLDVTARKRAEEEAARFLAREQAARREAEEANRIKDEFLATLSHELRTPLTAIVGWALMLRDGRLDPSQRQLALDTIVRNAKSQCRLIDDLLDVSRIITGKLHFDVKSVEIALVINAAVASVSPAALAKGIHLELMLDAGPCVVLGDPDRLKQVIWNLLSNAIKFTPANGWVRVTLKRAHSSVIIKVKDSGLGMEPEFLPHVFDRFRQADGTTTRENHGLGLGLAIVRHLVELHGGTVQAESPGPGLGSTFAVHLPASVATEQTAGATRA